MQVERLHLVDENTRPCQPIETLLGEKENDTRWLSRTRKPLEVAVVVVEARKRPFNETGLKDDAENPPVKRQVREEKKAVTAIVHVHKEERNVAQKRWLHHHRGLFQPLLHSTTVFENIRKEIERSKEEPSFVPLHELDTQPKLVTGGSLKDYQLTGLSFLTCMYHNGMNCILGDEMGLGKTLQTLALLAYIKETAKGSHDSHLVVCPLSVLQSWEAETARWVPSLRVIRFHGPASERDRLKNSLRGDVHFDLMLTTYEAYAADDAWFKKRRWMYCVLDEGHKIKNAGTQISHKLQTLGSMYRLILSGTPVQNNLVELWSILHWLYPNIFTGASERLFKESFDLTKGSYTLPFIKAVQDLMAVIMLRRTKAIVEATVPPREELTIFIPMTESQRFWTYRLLTKMDAPDLQKIFGSTSACSLGEDTLGDARQEVLSHLESHIQASSTGGKEQNEWKKLMNLLMQLRKVCDHPYLLPNAEPQPYFIGEHIVASSSKLIAIDKLLADCLPKGERVLIFSQWTGMLDLLEDFMTMRSIPYCRLDGSTNRARRTLNIRLFQQEKSPYKVFLVSTKAGGLGINLTMASTVIMCDSDWNPQNDLQAIARAHRIGQRKTVKVYRLICRASVEDQMLDRTRRKLFLSARIMRSDGISSSSDNTSLGTGELLSILRNGSSALTSCDDEMNLAQFLDSDISQILNLSRVREIAREAKMKHDLELNAKVESGLETTESLLKDAEVEQRQLLSGVAQVQSRLFEGKLVHKPSNQEIAREWKELQKRARVDRTIAVGGMTFLLPEQHIRAADSVLVKEAITSQINAKKKPKPERQSEDWCVICRDGGELMLCTSCPRVFHTDCRQHFPGAAQRSGTPCTQHNCDTCLRKTVSAGGMLFRCQTCWRAFCEDCLPPGELDAVGDNLPEFELLNHGPKDGAYYIRCHFCHEEWSANPKLWKEWEDEMRKTRASLDKKYASPRI